MADKQVAERVPGKAPTDEQQVAVLDRTGLIARVKRRVFSDGTLTKKASLNSVALMLDFLARAIAGLVMNPILVHYLGDTGFGDWQILQRLVAHTNPAGGRPSEALKWFVANRQSSTDIEEKRRAVGSAAAVWVMFVPVLLSIGVVVSWFAPVWLHVPTDIYFVIRLAGMVLIFDILVQGISNIPWAVFAGQNLGYKRMGLTASFEFVAAGLMIAAAVLGTALLGLAVATVVTDIFVGLLYLWLVRTYVSWWGISKPEWPAVRRFIGLSWWFLLWKLVMTVSTGADIIVLGIAGSASAVTTYTLNRFVPVTIMAAVTSLIYGMTPGLGGLIGAGEVVRGARVRNETMSIAWLMATVAGAGVVAWDRTFINIWVSGRYYPGLLSTVLIALMVLQFSLIRVDSNIIDLTLNLRTKVLLGLLSAGLSVAFAWVLVSHFELGIPGVVIGFMAGRSVQSFTYPVMVGRILDIPIRTQLLGLVRAGVVSGVIFVVATILGRLDHADTILALLFGGGVTGVTFLAIALLGGLSTQQPRWLWRRARRVALMR